MLLGSEIGAALTALEPLGIDYIGLNCATGPAEMSEHLRYLSRHAPVGVSVMPNAGLPQLGPNGAVYPLTPASWPRRCPGSSRSSGSAWSAAAAAPPRSTCGRWSRRSATSSPAPRRPRPDPGLSSLYQAVPFQQDASRADGRRADQRQRLQGVSRGHAGRELAELRRHRPRADPRRRAPARPERRLRRAGTAPPTCGRWRPGWPPRPRCRS